MCARLPTKRCVFSSHLVRIAQIMKSCAARGRSREGQEPFFEEAYENHHFTSCRAHFRQRGYSVGGRGGVSLPQMRRVGPGRKRQIGPLRERIASS